MSTAKRVLGRWTPAPMTVAIAALVVLAEWAFATVHLQTTRTGVANPVLAFAVPWIWINLSLLVFAFVRPAPDAGKRWPASVIAVGYFAVLAVAGGLLTTGPSGGGGPTLQLAGATLGWTPLLIVPGSVVNLVVVPFKLVGYLALTYLVYVTVRDASGALVGGIVGLFSCVSCTFPILAALLSGLAGGGTAAATVAYANSYHLSTAVFVVSVGLLAWRPSIDSVAAIRSLWHR